MSYLYLLLIIAAFVAFIYLNASLRTWRLRRQFGHELADPIDVEVLYEGQAIADLSDRKFEDMFWHSYAITPRTPAARQLIENDDLWNRSAITFRDPRTGDLCTTAIPAGGSFPFVRSGRISIRALYFGGKFNQGA